MKCDGHCTLCTITGPQVQITFSLYSLRPFRSVLGRICGTWFRWLLRVELLILDWRSSNCVES